MSLNARSLATVLAALRHWQQRIEDDHSEPPFQDLFDEHAPLSSDEIDELCEELNCWPGSIDSLPTPFLTFGECSVFDYVDVPGKCCEIDGTDYDVLQHDGDVLIVRRWDDAKGKGVGESIELPVEQITRIHIY